MEPKCKKAVAHKFFWRGPGMPPILVNTLSKFTQFQSCLKVSRRSAEGAWRYSAAKWQKQTNK